MMQLPELDERLARAKASRRYGTALTDGLFMTSRDGLIFNRWKEAFLRPAQERYRQPVRPGREKDLVAVLEVLRLVLQIVHHDEDVGLRDLVEVAEPRQEARLMRGDDHFAPTGTAACAAPWCPRVSQLELSSVNRPSGVRRRYATGMSTAIGRKPIGWTRSHGGRRRTLGAK